MRLPAFHSFVLLAALLALYPLAAHATEPANVQGMELVSWGTYALGEVTVLQDYSGVDPGEFWLQISQYELMEQSDTAPMALGVVFGVEFMVQGEPQGAEVVVDAVLLHPPMELDNEVVTRQESRLYAHLGEPLLHFYMLEFAEELQPGDWTFSFACQGHEVRKTLHLN